ncbi:MAG: hypothetical protein JKX84_02210, partial [Flavobacteriales bacterium]|nr:hypothetical protein [Flavobacteriales bacterium]
MRNHRFNTFSALFFIGIVAISISACTEDYFNLDKLDEDFITWEPDLAFPLVHSSLNGLEIIGVADSTNIYDIAPDNFLTLIYRRRIFSQTINDVFQLPASMPLPDTEQLTASEISDLGANDQVSTTFSGNHNFGIITNPGAQLNVIRFLEGELVIDVTGNFDQGGTVIATFSELKLGGVPLSETIFLTTLNGQVTGSSTVNLTGYEMDLDANGPNSVLINYSLTLINVGGAPLPTPANQLQVVSNFSDTRLAYADGDFGTFALDVQPNDVDVDIFGGGENEGTIYFEDPKLLLKISNSFGVPFEGNINQLFASGEQGVTPVDYSQVVPGGVFNILAPLSLGDSTYQEYLF